MLSWLCWQPPSTLVGTLPLETVIKNGGVERWECSGPAGSMGAGKETAGAVLSELPPPQDLHSVRTSFHESPLFLRTFSPPKASSSSGLLSSPTVFVFPFQTSFLIGDLCFPSGFLPPSRTLVLKKMNFPCGAGNLRHNFLSGLKISTL